MSRSRSRAGRAAVWALASVALGGSQALASIPEERVEPGEQVWDARVDFGGYDWASSIVAGPDGSSVYVTGGSALPGQRSDIVTVANSSITGEQLWVSRFNGAADGGDSANAIAVSPDGSTVFVTGSSTVSDSVYAAVTIAYAADTGEQRWVAYYVGPEDEDRGVAIAVSPDGTTVFVAMESWGTGGYDFATLAYSASTGEQRWAQRYDEGADEGIRALAVSPNGARVFVTGYTEATQRRYLTIAYSASGQRLWDRTFAGTAPAGQRDASPSGIAVSRTGSHVFVTGTSVSEIGSPDYATVAYDALLGTQAWVTHFEGPTVDYDFAIDVVASPVHDILFVTGATGTFTTVTTVSYQAVDGSLRWTRNHPMPEGTVVPPAAMTIHGHSALFVVGTYPRFGTSHDYGVLAIAPSNGAKLWESYYAGPDLFDIASAVAVSPDGSKVFVTGASYINTTPDYGTAAFRVTTCANGSDEYGTLSAPVHDAEAHLPGGVIGSTATPVVHGVNCDVIRAGNR